MGKPQEELAQQSSAASRAPLSAATRKLHETLIRLAKGMISAWEDWLSRQ